MKRLGSADFLKGLSISIIMICHASQVAPGVNQQVLLLCSFGQMGCQMFFMLSGYLMCASVEKRGIESLKPQTYLKKKFFGENGIILPWYIIIISYYCITQLILIKDLKIPFLSNTDFKALIINFLFLNGLVPSANNNVVLGGWYIGTMVLLWLLFPCVYFAVKRWGTPMYVSIQLFLVLIALSIGKTWGVANNSFLYFSPVIQLPCMLHGIYLYFINKKEEVFENNYLLKNILTIICALIAIKLFYSNFWYSFCILPLVVAFVYGRMMLFLTKNFLKLEQKAKVVCHSICWLGRNSLYLYLTHVFAVYHIQWLIYNNVDFDISPNIVFILLLFLCGGIAVFFALMLKCFAKLLRRICEKVYLLMR